MEEAKSQEYSVQDAAELIGGMATAAEVKAFIKGDSRKGVVAAAEARLTAKPGPVNGPPKGNVPSDEQKTEDRFAFERPYATIIIPKGSDKNDPKTVTVQVFGTFPDGLPYSFRRVLRRGVEEHNIPANIRKSVNDLIETTHKTVEKDDRSGNELVREDLPRWSFTIVREYNEKITDADLKKK